MKRRGYTNFCLGFVMLSSYLTAIGQTEQKKGDHLCGSATINSNSFRSIQSSAKNLLSTLTYDELEIDATQTNNTLITAEKISNFKSPGSLANKFTISGAFTPAQSTIIALPDVVDFSENGSSSNDDLGSETEIMLAAVNTQSTFTGFIGDGDKDIDTGNSIIGDVDNYRVMLPANTTLSIVVSATDTDNLINPGISIIQGVRTIATITTETENSVEYTFEAIDEATELVFQIADFATFSGRGNRRFINRVKRNRSVGNEGPYSIQITLSEPEQADIDYYAIDLIKGDVVGLSTTTNTVEKLQFFTPDNQIGTSSFGNNATLRGFELSPLQSGNISLSYLAPESGTYFISAEGTTENYETEVIVTRPSFEINKGQKQIIYIDFTGESISKGSIQGFPTPTGDPVFDANFREPLERLRDLSAFETFIENWGLENTEENKLTLTTKIVNVIKENFETDFRANNINPNFEVLFVSDYGIKSLGERIPEMLENENVKYSRIIIGGTTTEFNNIGFEGEASSVDPGNFILDDVAVIHLGLLSDTNPNESNSLNNIALAPGASKEDLIAIGVGNFASHEIGHFLGCFHTVSSNNVFSLMDFGFNVPTMVGLGRSRTAEFGDQNTQDIDFINDIYDPSFRAATAEANVAGLNLIDTTIAYSLGFIPLPNGESINQVVEDELVALEKETLAAIESILTPSTPVDTPLVSLKIEAEDFALTGGDFDDAPFGGSGTGVNRTAKNINFVNAGDWASYIVNVTEAGSYKIEYSITTPSDNAEIQLELDGAIVATDAVINNGSWDNFTPLTSTTTLNLTTGLKNLRVNATSTNIWQWNLDKISLIKIETTGAKLIENTNKLSVVISPNPAVNYISVYGIHPNETMEYKIYDFNGSVISKGNVTATDEVFVENLSAGMYFIQLTDNSNTTYTKKFFKE
ncbi:carbohydrate-binding protein [Aquimarina agarivorans]|uniref:carbohydrate-binding protein n=1 Tax=Aquimarina agarivorans TaxID=980584 RepID=UPI000248FDA4|nr:carbohydrate-binding protein [Aquimarina agarivorans]